MITFIIWVFQFDDLSFLPLSYTHLIYQTLNINRRKILKSYNLLPMSQQDRITSDGNIDYLFGPRISFVASQDELLSSCNVSLSQNPQDFPKKRFPDIERFVGELKSSQDIFNAYAVFYSLIYFCRFDEKGVLQTSGLSKEELKKKKVKDIESQKKAKIKKTLSMMGQSQSNYDSWMEVINHKNLFKHITEAQTYLKKIVGCNFEIVGKGVAKIKNSQLENSLQIRLCVLVIDIISLINTMKFMLNPFTQTDALVSKLIQQESVLFKEAFSKLNANGQLEGVNELNIKMFYDALKFLMSQSQNKLLKYWFDIQEIRQRYLIGQNTLIRTKPTQSNQKKINSGIISANDSTTYEITEIQLEWLNISNQYYLNTNQPINQNLSRIFKEYSQFFNYNIDEIIKKQQKQQIIQKYVEYYFSLIKNIWTQLDRSSAQELYIDEIFKINNKFKLPLAFVKSASGIVKEMIEQQVIKFTQTKNGEYLKKIKSMTFDLSEKLLCLQPRDDLIDDYFAVLQKGVITLLCERQAMDKLFQKVYSLQTNIKLEEFFDIISKIQSLISEKSFESTIRPSNNRKENLNDVIESLYKTYEDEKDLIDQIKYFLKTVKALNKNEVDEDELQNTKQFYSKKKIDIFSSDNVISASKLSNLPFGLLDFVRILTFELIFKIKLKINSNQIDEDQKFLFKILKFYQKEKQKFKIYAKENTIMEIQSNEMKENDENQEWDADLEATELLLKNVRSKNVNLDELRIELNQQDEIGREQNNRFHNFATEFIKKIYELRLEIVRKNIKEHELKQKPLEKDFIEMKNIIYTTIIKTQNNNVFHQELSQLARIQYWFIKKRYYKAWRAIRKLKKIEEIKDLLENAWTKDRNVLKIHIKLFLKYQGIYFNSRLISNRNDISQSQVTNLVDDVLRTEPTIANISNIEEAKQFVSELKAAVKILDRIEKVDILRREIQKRDEEKRSLQEAKTYDLIEENNQFSMLNGKLKIYRVQKLGVIMMRKYIIKCPTKETKSIEGKLKILKKLSLNNINVEIKDLDKIEITVDEVQNQFDSYPKLVRYLIEAYHRIINFCKNQLQFKLYPILKKKDFQFTVKNDRHFSFKINPYEGILLNLLLSYQELKKSGLFVYPKHPFVAFSNQVKEKFKDQKIYILKSTDKNITTEEYGFQHLIDQMRSISLENDTNNLNLVVENILKCPYFWSSTDKSFELVEFKERLHSMVNAEQCRRKQNNRLIRSLEEESEEWEDPTTHKDYKKSYGYSKLTQMYLSIEGVMEKQAFLEDIGNFRKYGQNEQFRLQNYQWDLDYDCEEKKELKKLIQMIAKKERKKGNRNSTLYKKTFPSFNTQIRHLRNLLSHYIYDDENKIEYSLDYKLRLIEKSFAKIFVFIYRWKNYLNKNFEEIKDQRIKLLLSIFKEHDKMEMIQRLLSIKQLEKYNKVNNNINYFLNMFKYSFDNRNDCEACNILCLVFRRKSSLWELLADDYKKKEGKVIQNPPYNHFFYEHHVPGCNGMNFLLPYFLNTIRRDNFTAEEAALIRSPLVALRLQAEKINRRIERLRTQGYNENESQDSDNDSNEQPANERRDTLPVEKRCEQLSESQKQKYFEDMQKFDYVNKNTIYQIELRFPFIFDDLRRERHQWDFNARKFDE